MAEKKAKGADPVKVGDVLYVVGAQDYWGAEDEPPVVHNLIVQKAGPKVLLVQSHHALNHHRQLDRASVEAGKYDVQLTAESAVAFYLKRQEHAVKGATQRLATAKRVLRHARELAMEHGVKVLGG